MKSKEIQKFFSILQIVYLLVFCSTNTFGQVKKDKTMDQRISVITLGVHDLDKTMDFYENTFGWQRAEISTEDIVFYQFNELFLSLYAREALAEDAEINSEGTGFKGFTFSYNTNSEREVDDLIRSFKEKGVKIVKLPQKAFWGGYSGYVSDPDGNLWEIVYNPFMEN